MAATINTAEQLTEPRDWTDTEPTDADWQAVGWQSGLGIVPERVLIDLPDRDGRPGGEANILFAWDVDGWLVASATFIDGEPVELTSNDRRFIKGKLDARAEQLRIEW